MNRGCLKAGVKCPSCGSDDTVVMAVILGCPYEADILCRKCKRIFGYSYYRKRHSLLCLDYDEHEIALALKDKWWPEIYTYEEIEKRPVIVRILGKARK